MNRCQFKECRSGLPGSVRVCENIGDGSWSTLICYRCSEIVGLRDGDDIPCDVEMVNRELRRAYERGKEHEAKDRE